MLLPGMRRLLKVLAIDLGGVGVAYLFAWALESLGVFLWESFA